MLSVLSLPLTYIMSSPLQARTRFFGAATLLLLGGWMLHSYLALLLWAVVLAVATWPIYQRFLTLDQRQGKMTWVAIGLILLIAAFIFIPLCYSLNLLLQEAGKLEQLLHHAQAAGVPPPIWLETIPMIGPRLSLAWADLLGTPAAAQATLQGIDMRDALGYGKLFAGQLLHRFFGFLMVLLALLFVYQHGDTLAQHVYATSNRVFGAKGGRYLLHASASVRATVNGMVLIGLGKGLLLGMAYAWVGFGNPAILGAVTGVFALIPFAAKLIFGACALVLAADGQLAASVGLFAYGMVLTLIADNYVRPALIGGAVKLPFLWTLLGIFGGMDTFGLLGLFLGPALMATLMSVWRDWLEDLQKGQA